MRLFCSFLMIVGVVQSGVPEEKQCAFHAALESLAAFFQPFPPPPQDPLDRVLSSWRETSGNPMIWLIADCYDSSRCLTRVALQRLLFRAVESVNRTALREVLRRAHEEAGFDPRELARDARSPEMRLQLGWALEPLPPCSFTLAQYAATLDDQGRTLRAVVEAGADPVDGRIRCGNVEYDYYTPLYLAMARRAGSRRGALWLLSLNRTEHLSPLVLKYEEPSGRPIVDTLEDRKRDGSPLLVAHRKRDEELVDAMLRAGALQVHDGEIARAWQSPGVEPLLQDHRPVMPDALDYRSDQRVPDRVLAALRHGLFEMWAPFSRTCCVCKEGADSNPFVLAARANNDALFDSLLRERLAKRDGGVHPLVGRKDRFSVTVRGERPLMSERDSATTLALLFDDDSLREPYAMRFAENMTSAEVYQEFEFHGRAYTALHLAAAGRSRELLEALLGRARMGPDVACQGTGGSWSRGTTPLYAAVAIGDCPECVETLVRAGANPNLMVNAFPLWRHARSPEVLAAIRENLFASKAHYQEALRDLCEPRWEDGDDPPVCSSLKEYDCCHQEWIPPTTE